MAYTPGGPVIDRRRRMSFVVGLLLFTALCGTLDAKAGKER
jgi:hypothetical protein